MIKMTENLLKMSINKWGFEYYLLCFTVGGNVAKAGHKPVLQKTEWPFQAPIETFRPHTKTLNQIFCGHRIFFSRFSASQGGTELNSLRNSTMFSDFFIDVFMLSHMHRVSTRFSGYAKMEATVAALYVFANILVKQLRTLGNVSLWHPKAVYFVAVDLSSKKLLPFFNFKK